MNENKLFICILSVIAVIALSLLGFGAAYWNYHNELRERGYVMVLRPSMYEPVAIKGEIKK